MTGPEMTNSSTDIDKECRNLLTVSSSPKTQEVNYVAMFTKMLRGEVAIVARLVTILSCTFGELVFTKIQ